MAPRKKGDTQKGSPPFLLANPLPPSSLFLTQDPNLCIWDGVKKKQGFGEGMYGGKPRLRGDQRPPSTRFLPSLAETPGLEECGQRARALLAPPALPQPQALLLQELAQHLGRLCQGSRKNRLSARLLGELFGELLLHPAPSR